MDWHRDIELSAEWTRRRVHVFISGICRARLANWPDDLETMHILGNVLTAMGAHEEALDVDRELVRSTPEDSVAVYNLACSLSNLHQLDEALVVLLRAIEIGYRDYSFVEEDPDLANLRDDPRFEEVRLRIRQKS